MTGSCLLYVTVIRLLELLKLLLNHSSRAISRTPHVRAAEDLPLTHSVRPLPRKEAAFNDIIFFGKETPRDLPHMHFVEQQKTTEVTLVVVRYFEC